MASQQIPSRPRQRSDMDELAQDLSRRSRSVLSGFVGQLEAAEGRLWAADEALSAGIFKATRGSAAQSAASGALSLSGDEALWFILPVVAASLLTVPLGGPQAVLCGLISCELELILDLFGAMAVCATLEQALKCFFQRPRPACRDYDTRHCCIWGEWHSFPSGHSMRAVYVVNWLFFGAHASMLLAPPAWLLPLALAWALGVAYARVAHGRHHPVDVLAGLVVGLAASRVAENALSDHERALLKAGCGVSVALQVWVLLLGPGIYRAVLAGTGSKAAARAGTAGVALSYFGFLSAAFLSFLRILAEQDTTLDGAGDAVCHMGRLSYSQVAGGGAWQCRTRSFSSLPLFGTAQT